MNNFVNAFIMIGGIIHFLAVAGGIGFWVFFCFWMYQHRPLTEEEKTERCESCQSYDTLACVGNLKKAMTAGDMLTEEEILALQVAGAQANMDGISKPSKKWTRNQKKMAKR